MTVGVVVDVAVCEIVAVLEGVREMVGVMEDVKEMVGVMEDVMDMEEEKEVEEVKEMVGVCVTKGIAICPPFFFSS